MAVVEELLRSEQSGAISFGNHQLEQKAKVEDFEHAGDLLKVKTFREMTNDNPPHSSPPPHSQSSSQSPSSS